MIRVVQQRTCSAEILTDQGLLNCFHIHLIKMTVSWCLHIALLTYLSFWQTQTSMRALSRWSDCSHIVTDNKSDLFTAALLWPDTTSISIIPSGPISSTAPLLPLMSPSTSPHIIHLSTCGPTLHSSSFPLLKQPLIPLSTPLYIFFRTYCPSHPIPLAQLPTSISLPLPKTLLSSLSLAPPPCYFAVPSVEVEVLPTNLAPVTSVCLWQTDTASICLSDTLCCPLCPK